MPVKRTVRPAPRAAGRRASGKAAGARYVIPFQDVRLDAIAEVGGKNASLGELINALAPVGARVPKGFALTGVIFTLDTESGFPDVVLVTGAWGRGETVVQGRVRPDEFWVHKPTLVAGYRPIVRRGIARVQPGVAP